MDFRKLAPWNWFKNEEEESEMTMPVKRTGPNEPLGRIYSPIGQLHQEMEQLFDHFFRDNGASPFRSGKHLSSFMAEGLLKPTLDIGANDKEYVISVEVPGVDQQDVKLEVVNNTLMITGEKKQEREEKERGYYRMERSYGSFQRVLSLPDDADQDSIKATFKNGVLHVSIKHKELPLPAVKQIQIK
ncbi:MAG: Hsp20/alpha crystallin family protein [Desulfobulbaceae bacterium]|nr:Hsp20/alpha crystallin family protein [Desulfobulbaceae bacterium]